MTTMMMRKVCALAVAAAVLVSTAASAAVTRFYSGQQCQWYDGSVAGLQYSGYGLVNNQVSGWRGAYCPASGYTDSNLVTISSAGVWFYDGAADSAVSCSWQITNWDGSLRWNNTHYSCSSTWGSQCLGNDAPGYVGMNEMVFDSNPVVATYALNVTAYCLVPHGSTIYGYNMTTAL